MTGSNLRLTQGFEVLRPKADKAFPIPCAEWDVLREQIAKLSMEPWVFHTVGSMLVGAALATIISIWTGAVTNSASTPNALVVGWAIAAVTGGCGIASLYFAQKERSVHRSRAGSVVTQMQLIEQRFERVSGRADR
jgi:hypothetical protein